MSLIIPINAEELIRKEFSPKVMSTMVSLVGRGYKLAKGATRHVTFLDWDLGKDHEGYLRRLAINYLFKKECEKGGLPFTLSTESNRNKSHRFLLFGTGSIKMTISQVDSVKKIARPAFFRDKLQEANQVTLNLFGEDTSSTVADKDYYLLLTYSSGGNRPNFINLGMPNGKHWIDKINLLNEPHVISSNQDKLDKEEIIEPEVLIGLRNFAEEVEGFGS